MWPTSWWWPLGGSIIPLSKWLWDPFTTPIYRRHWKGSHNPRDLWDWIQLSWSSKVQPAHPARWETRIPNSTLPALPWSPLSLTLFWAVTTTGRILVNFMLDDFCTASTGSCEVFSCEHHQLHRFQNHLGIDWGSGSFVLEGEPSLRHSPLYAKPTIERFVPPGIGWSFSELDHFILLSWSTCTLSGVRVYPSFTRPGKWAKKTSRFEMDTWNCWFATFFVSSKDLVHHTIWANYSKKPTPGFWDFGGNPSRTKLTTIWGDLLASLKKFTPNTLETSLST